MTAIVPHRMPGLTRHDSRRLSLFTKTVGKELRGAEIDEAIEWCEHYQANPFVNDIYFFVFDANDAEKRRVVPVLGIGHYRKQAARHRDYRPDDRPPRFTYCEPTQANPKGIAACEVTVYKHVAGGWHAVTSSLKWEERAPIIAGGFRWEDTGEVWKDTGKPKKRKVADQTLPDILDPKKKNWETMGETMLAKCVEADALRKGWPEALSGSYLSEELDAANTIELTATEIVKEHEAEERTKRLNVANTILIDWCDGKELQPVQIGKLGDQALAFIKQHAEEPSAVLVWQQRNRHGFNEYWARDKDGALAVKAAIEKVQSSLQQEAAE